VHTKHVPMIFNNLEYNAARRHRVTALIRAYTNIHGTKNFRLKRSRCHRLASDTIPYRALHDGPVGLLACCGQSTTPACAVCARCSSSAASAHMSKMLSNGSGKRRSTVYSSTSSSSAQHADEPISVPKQALGCPASQTCFVTCFAMSAML